LFLKADGTPGELKATGMGGFLRKSPNAIYHLAFHLVGTEQSIRTLLASPAFQQAVRSQGLDPNIWDPTEVVSATNYDQLKKDSNSKLSHLLEDSKSTHESLDEVVEKLGKTVEDLKFTKSNYRIQKDPVGGMRLRMLEAQKAQQVLNVSEFTAENPRARKVNRPKTDKASKSAISSFPICSDNVEGIRNFLAYIGESAAVIDQSLKEWKAPTGTATA
jgi:hypothetical protein